MRRRGEVHSQRDSDASSDPLLLSYEIDGEGYYAFNVVRGLVLVRLALRAHVEL